MRCLGCGERVLIGSDFGTPDGEPVVILAEWRRSASGRRHLVLHMCRDYLAWHEPPQVQLPL